MKTAYGQLFSGRYLSCRRAQVYGSINIHSSTLREGVSHLSQAFEMLDVYDRLSKVAAKFL